MLAMVGDKQTDWDIQLPHADNAYNSSVSTATGLLSPPWEQKQDLQHHRLHILRY